ncbi:MAG: hypothetical protein ABIU58_10465 [Ramlibacter sp.]
MLNPELGALLFQVALHRSAGCARPLLIEIECRHPLQAAGLREVIEIARQHHGSGLGQLQRQDLVAGRVTRCGLEDDGAVTEHIALVGLDHERLAFA